MDLPSAIHQALAEAERLKDSGSANEANTKALVLEPLMAALGWDPTQLTVVDREYRVYDGTSLDHALKIDGRPRLFVEAKAVSKSLDDKQLIAQTVNYANNEGVIWCVLTNGVIVRVYKTNEPVAMEQKLLFEVDLAEAASDTRKSAESLELISQASVKGKRLDEWGERVFTDTRVRHALAQLGADPPKEVIRRVEALLDQPKIPDERLRSSLARILGATVPMEARPPASDLPSELPRRVRGTKTQYTIEHHTGGKPTAIADLFERLDDYGQGLGGDVTRRILKVYVSYLAGSKERSFFTAEVQRQKILVHISLDPMLAQPWNEETMRDVREIGHYGMGGTEYVLRTPEQLDELKGLIKAAYERVR